MTGIWTNTGEGWQLGYPQVFQEEATLHKLIEENPQLLPLAGSPRLTILGSEIKLGTGVRGYSGGGVERAPCHHRSKARRQPRGTQSHCVAGYSLRGVPSWIHYRKP